MLRPLGASVLLLVAVACSSFPTGDDPAGIEGMSADALTSALGNAGLDCSGPDDSKVGYTVACVEVPNVAGVNGSGTYVNELAFVEIYVLDGNRETLERLADVVLSVPYQGSDPDAATAWLGERLDAGDCVLPEASDEICSETFGAAEVSVQVAADASDLMVSLSGGGPAPSAPETLAP
jgi:hypothetical protein